MQVHPKADFNIVKNIEFPWPVADMIIQHHERMNGFGYPNGLKGEEILLETKILRVDTCLRLFKDKGFRFD